MTTEIITAIEAETIARTYNAKQAIVDALPQDTAQTTDAFGNSTNVASEGKLSALRIIQTELTEVNGKGSLVAKAGSAEKLKLVNEIIQNTIYQTYYSQITRIQSLANAGKFQVIFSATEQAKSDLLPYLAKYGYILTQIPVSAVVVPQTSFGYGKPAGAISGLSSSNYNSQATYNGQPIAYVDIQGGSNMVLVSWNLSSKAL